jgi:hypothetical protein
MMSLLYGMVNVLHAKYPRSDFTNEMIKTTVRLLDEYNIRLDNSCRIFVDAANPSFISTLKQVVNEDSDYPSRIVLVVVVPFIDHSTAHCTTFYYFCPFVDIVKI